MISLYIPIPLLLPLYPLILRNLLLCGHLDFSKALNDQVLALSPLIDVLDVICNILLALVTMNDYNARNLTCRGLEVACRIVALRDEDVVVAAILNGLVQWDGGTHELLLDLAEALEAGLKLEMVVAVTLSDGADNGNVVTLGADVVCR